LINTNTKESKKINTNTSYKKAHTEALMMNAMKERNFEVYAKMYSKKRMIINAPNQNKEEIVDLLKTAGMTAKIQGSYIVVYNVEI